MNVLMLVGSLRADSWTARLTDSVAGLLPAGSRAAYADIAALPHYDEDLDTATPPAAVVAFRAALAEADGLVVATPEYNGSMPGVLKNAIDWASRPRGSAPIAGLPTAVLSVSPSPRGAQWAREDAEKVLKVAGAVPLAESVGVAAVHETLVDGALTDADVTRRVGALVEALLTAERPAA